MTRVLIIGSSHVGAYKNAAESCLALYDDITLDFFGVRGPLFLGGKINRKGLFVVPCRDDEDRAFVTQTNGAEHIELAGYDHILMVGHRFSFHNIAGLLEHHDLLEGMRTGRKHLMSEAMAREVITTVTNIAVAEATERVASHNGSICFAMAPYPASSITERGDGYTLSRILRLFWERPDAKWIYETWHAQVLEALGQDGHHLLVQPGTLCAGPFATKPEYAGHAAALGGDTMAKTDHRHMNADYGLAMLRTYIETHLGHAPMRDAQPPLNERIA